MLYALLKPLLFRLDAERAHTLVAGLLRASAGTPLLGLAQALLAYDDPALATTCAGLRFVNPIGLAAGFDKRALLIEPLAALGFGHIEVGTVTPRAQPGNERPRMFRLPEDSALINRLGFNSPGMVAVARRLRAAGRANMAHSTALVAHGPAPVLGVNIGKNRSTPLEHAVQDYLAAFMALAPQADYIAINISSPNTPGLRRLHDRAALEQLVGELVGMNRRLAHPRPLLLKISPDESPAQLAEVAQVASAAGISGFIATNTTLARPGLRGTHAGESGGLSGAPLAALARERVAQLYTLTHGRLPIIGVGGISSGAEAYARIRAGASLVQLYTGLIYAGPSLIFQIKRDLARLLRRDGFASLAAAIGADHVSFSPPQRHRPTT